MTMNYDCPHCGHHNTEASGIGTHERPDDGSLTICIECGRWSVVADGRLRLPTDRERAHIHTDEKCWKIMLAWRQMNDKRAADRSAAGNRT